MCSRSCSLLVAALEARSAFGCLNDAESVAGIARQLLTRGIQMEYGCLWPFFYLSGRQAGTSLFPCLSVLESELRKPGHGAKLAFGVTLCEKGTRQAYTITGSLPQICKMRNYQDRSVDRHVMLKDTAHIGCAQHLSKARASGGKYYWTESRT